MKNLTCILLILILTCTAKGQKVGLVLSGGGAKGIAHIGVIRVLEEHGIPIDYVAGTSMGAIVAGLYASGMTPDEMIELFNSDEFRLWSTGRMDKDDYYYFKRNDERPDWLQVDIARLEDKIKVRLPLNIVPERQMDFAFLELTAQTTAACQGDFDRLLVPFRCVSTDIYHNKAVIHKNGDLGEAIRASMTFPFVYKPIEKDGMLLFDGGIVNNFPADVMKEEFNPDFIIGHKVTNLGETLDPEDLFSQLETMVTQITNYEIPDSSGILLETKLNNVNLFDFPKANYIYSRGIETTLVYIDSIKSRVQRRVDKAEIDKRRKVFKEKMPALKFNNIQVEGVKDNSQRKYIIQSIKFKERVIDLEQLKSSYFKLVEDEQIKSIRPLAYYNRSTGLFDLDLKVETRKPLDIEFGGHLSTRSNTFGFIQANLKTFNQRAYKLSSNLYFGRFYNAFNLAGRIDFPTRIPFYMNAEFNLNLWDYFSTSTDLIFTDIKPTYIKQNENNILFEMGIPYTKTGIIDFGIAHSNLGSDYYQTDIFESGDKLDETRFRGYTAHIRIDKKNYDFKQYPTEGGRKLMSFQFVDGTEIFEPGTTAPINEKIETGHQYFLIKGCYDQYFKPLDYISLGLTAEAVFSNDKVFNNYSASKLYAPAFQPTPNSKSVYNEAYRANHYFALGGKFLYQFNSNLHFRSEVYAFFPIQSFLKGEQNTASLNDEYFTEAHLMAMGALVMQTRLGPLSAEMNYYDKPGEKWFFSINMGYMLFNKRVF